MKLRKWKVARTRKFNKTKVTILLEIYLPYIRLVILNSHRIRTAFRIPMLAPGLAPDSHASTGPCSVSRPCTLTDSAGNRITLNNVCYVPGSEDRILSL